jgi:diacylglycerol kinase family enzyme
MDAVTIINRDKADRDAIADALSASGVGGAIELIEGSRIEERSRDAVNSGAPLLIVGGGDGSVSAAAGAVAGTGTALGILPLGTLNHLARDLGIPDELKGAVEVIAAGNERHIDVAEVNGRIFVNNSAIGLYPLMVVDRDTQQRRLGRSKRVAMIVASLRTLLRFHDNRLRLSADGREELLDTPLLFVGNNDYRLALPAAGQRDALDDGKLCVLVMRKKSVPGFLAATTRALFGLARSDDMVRMDDVSRLRVDSSRRSLIVSIDGETCSLSPPLDYRILPGALKVLAPPAQTEEPAA